MARKVAPDDDAPEITAEMFARMKPMKDVTPWAAEAIKAARRGRPPVADAKQVVSIRLPGTAARHWSALAPEQRSKLVAGLVKNITLTKTKRAVEKRKTTAL
jgi:hypothetical protein